MYRDKRMTRLLAAVFLVLPLLLGACSINGDDDDSEDVPTVEDGAAVTMTAEPGDSDADASDVEDLAAQATDEPTSEAGEATQTDDEDDGEATASPSDSGEDDQSEDEQAGDQQGDGSEDLTTVVQEVTENVRPAVAFIAVTVSQQTPFGGASPQQGVGSGVIFDAEEGYILTNNHVVEGATELTVVLPDGRQFDATVVGRAPQQDIAVIQIEGEDLPSATLAEGGNLEIGQWVIAIGNALGLQGGASVTVGVVSALDRTLRPSEAEPPMEGLIQTDAAINPGNSGGPLLNLDGEVVGINTAKIPQAEGIGFAVPIDVARSIIDQIMTGEPRATLGVSVANMTPEIAVRYGLPNTPGVLVIEAQPDGPAAAAGLQPGDIILGLGGESIENLSQLRAALDEREPGETVTLTINRQGQEQQVEVELGESLVIQ